MIYPKNFEEKTGFDQIRQMLTQSCISSLGKGHVEEIVFCTQYAQVALMLDQTAEFREILLLGEAFPTANYYNPFEVFDRIRLQGTFIEPEELLELSASLETISLVIRFLKSPKTHETLKYPVLSRLTESIDPDPQILKQIHLILDEKGQIRNSASAKLSEIRQEKSKLENQALRRINQLLAHARQEGWIEPKTELALRNGRQVIPMPASYKRKIKGFVHDQSLTGQTVFLEPEEVFEINNEIRQLEMDERQEIIRILKVFTDFLRPHIPDLREAYLFLGQVDFIRAKASLAIKMDAQRPHLEDKPLMNWVKAKHPLLWLSHKAQNKHVEPLTLELDTRHRIMVISGPNAGGKSVCLKSAGLLQYMLQCGLLAPMEDYSVAGIFQKLFIDIGDEQSLENDLSTYSSHLLNMKFFLQQADAHSLFLIDEFGAGTEPKLGGAIAEAILTELEKRKALGVITTHYANLKILAGKHPSIINGSMLFDTQHMKPLYRLKPGNPGSSFAFEIAQTIGLPSHILKNAEMLAGSEHIDFDRQLQDLELKKMELEEKEKQLRKGDEFLSEIIDKYQKLSEDLENRKKEIILEARSEAKKLLQDSNRMVERTIREIKESNADKEKTKVLRQQLEEFTQEQFDPEEEMPAGSKLSKKEKKEKNRTNQPELEVDPSPIEKGDSVRIIGQQNIGEVMEIGGKEAMVAFGSIMMKTPIKRLEKLSKRSIRKIEKNVSVKYGFDINEKAAEFNPNLDIRGKRALDALVEVRRYVDDAILLGAKNIKILHGTGDGILREAIRDYLFGLSEVKRCRDEHPDRGGAGCTLVEFR